jgi:hypothetical protein
MTVEVAPENAGATEEGQAPAATPATPAAEPAKTVEAEDKTELTTEQWATKYAELLKESRKHEGRAGENFEDAKRWREYKEKLAPEHEKTAKQLQDTLAELDSLKLTILKNEIAAEMKLPQSAIGRLQGTTAEELKADAADLLALLGGVTPVVTRPKPLSTQGAGVGDATQSGRASTLEEYENMLRKKFK